MRMKRPGVYIIFLMALLNLSHIGHAQFSNKDLELERIIEAIFPLQDEDLNYDELYENLYQYYIQPIDLNNTEPEILQSTFLLSPFQVNSLYEYLEQNGPLISIYELQAVPQFDLNTIYRLLPFVTVKTPFLKNEHLPFRRSLMREYDNAFILRYDRTLEQKKGFSEPQLKSDSTLTSRYAGNEDKLLMRFILKPAKNISLRLSAEKDAGEELIWDPATKRYGADFISFHIAAKDVGKIKQIVVGDYQLQFGQGLVLGAGFAPGKGSETITTLKRGDLGIRPYSSVIESGYLRGAAATVSIGRFTNTTGFSMARRDAIEQVSRDSLLEENNFISAIQVTGFHRTPNEIAAKGAIKEHALAQNINYQSANRKLLIGLTGVYTHFEVPRIPVRRIYNQFEFKGSDNYTAGVYYNYTWQNMIFFGEAARSKSGGIGVVSGAMINLSKKWEMSMLFRKYDRNFHTFYGFAFGENTRNINESGIYVGLKYTHSRMLSLTAYFDQFYFPWLKYRVNAPSQGRELLTRLNLNPNKKLSIYGQYRREEKAINSSGEANIIPIVMGIKQNYLFNIDFLASRNLGFKSRLQFSNYKKDASFTRGFVLAQDVNISFWRLKFSSRVALFDTEDYDNRQYVYERDVLYSFSIPAYYGRGIRNYIMVQYNASKSLSFWARYARTHYKDKDTIGSGLEEIDGNQKTDVKFQIRYRF